MTAPVAADTSPVGYKCKPVEKVIGKTRVKLMQGDLTAQPVDAWVYYAREDLAIGSGYGTAIQMRGGVVIKNELETLGPIKMGEAVISGAGEMAAKHIIHAVGPKFQEPDLERKLRECMMSSLKTASENGVKTLAYPPMGSGFYGVPLDLSAGVMFDCFKTFLSGDSSIEEISIVVMDYRDFEPFAKKMESI